MNWNSRRHKDGRDVLCRVNGARFGDVLKDRKVVVTYEDIADKKKAYLQLLQNEKMASIGQLAAGGGPNQINTERPSSAAT